GGKGLFDESEFEPIRDWLSWMFGSASRAALLSLHLDDQLFAELRVICSADQKPLLFARDWRRRLDQVSGRVEQQLGGRDLVDYNRAVLKRYPRMLNILSRFTRQAVEGRQLVLRAYLPAVAAHNFALATRLFFEGEPAAPGQRGESSP